MYTRSSGSWRQQGAKLVGTGAIGPAQQGTFVALSADGNTAMVGGPYDDNQSGAVWVFTRSGSTWTQQGGKLVAAGSIGAAALGSVALSADGNTAVLGGGSDNNFAGSLWVFTRSNGRWTQEAKIENPDRHGNLGASVAISADGTTIISGMPHYDGGGAAWVFTKKNGTWTPQDSRLAGKPIISTEQGRAVAIASDGNTAVIGGPFFTGAAWVFARTGEKWSQFGDPLNPTGAVAPAAIGTSVSISGDGSTILVGGPTDANLGAAWVYARSSIPLISSSGVVNGASFLPGIAPGAWITVSGWNLSDTTRTWKDSDFRGNTLPTELDGVRVTVNGKPAYVYYISPSQLNVLAPEDATIGPVDVRVANGRGTSNAASVSQSALSPALFSLADSAARYAAAVRSDGVYVGPDAPAKPGDTVLLFGTGFGPTSPAQPIGQLVDAAPLAAQVNVQIGGVSASTTFAGLISPGLYQFNVTIPNVADGDRPVTISIGSTVTQPTLLLPVKR